MNSSFITLINPYARINKHNPEYMQFLSKNAERYGLSIITQSIEEAIRVCKEIAEKDIKIVGIVGGDGTVSTILGALKTQFGEKKLPKILVLRGGTMNVLASNLGIFGKPHEILEEFFHEKGPSDDISFTKVKTIRVNAEDEKIGFLFADGFSVRFLQYFYERKGGPLKAGFFAGKMALKGMLGYSKSFAQIFRMSKVNLKAWKESKDPVLQSSLDVGSVFVSTYEKLPLNIKFFKTSLQDPYAELCIVKKSGFRVLPIALKVVLGVKTPPEECERIGIKKLELQYPQEESYYTLDGEIFKYPKAPLQISLGPEFSFLLPRYKKEDGLR